MQHEGRIKACYAGEEPRRRTVREDTSRREETTPDPAPDPRPEEIIVPEPDILDELPLLEPLPQAEREPEEEVEDSDRESVVTADDGEAESDLEEPIEVEADIDPSDEPAAEEETVGVVDVPRREMPARERRPPQWLGEYVSRLYRMFHYMTQRTEPVFGGGDVVNEHALERDGGPGKGCESD